MLWLGQVYLADTRPSHEHLVGGAVEVAHVPAGKPLEATRKVA
jgi:hypothetical protein